MEIESNLSPNFSDLSIHTGLDVPRFSRKPWVSQPGNEVAEKGSEDVNIGYATLALKNYNAFMEESWLYVKVGCVAKGSIPDGHVVHMNFEAIRTDVPDASLVTFFAEFDVIENVATLQFMRPLGQTNSLPDKAEILGCTYCFGSGVHHSKINGCRSGREDLYPILLQKIQMMKDNENGMKEQYNGLALEDRCAVLALEMYNKEKRENFKLVETNGLGGSARIYPGLIMHLNFDARKIDDPERITFFAEAIKLIGKDVILVTFCMSLGPANLLPVEEIELCGCEYCSEDEDTIHPECGGYLTGRGRWKFR